MHPLETKSRNDLCSVLVTGANGFIGRALLGQLLQDKSFDPIAAVRRQDAGLPDGIRSVHVSPLEEIGNWKEALKGVDIVVHTAARVHVMDDVVSDPLSEFRKVNVEGTANLAQQAAEAGVKRFIFISSIKVNGESTETGKRFTPDDLPAPVDAYGISKHEAEARLHSVAANTNMQIVIIRPALVYGPQVRANFLSMMRWIYTGIPLPLGAIHNRRNLTGLSNLVDLIVTCARHPAAANQVFLAADDEDLSTTDLLRRTGAALGRRARLLPIPVGMIQTGAALIGKKHFAMRLCGNLQVDITKTKNLLSWKPPLSLDEGLRLTAAAYLTSRKPLSQ